METNALQHEHFRTRFSADWSSASGRTLIATGLWMRAGFIGACALVGGLLLMIRGDGRPAIAVSLALGGALIAVLAWRRARAILDHTDTDQTSAEAAAQRKTAAAVEAPALSRHQPRLAAE